MSEKDCNFNSVIEKNGITSRGFLQQQSCFLSFFEEQLFNVTKIKIIFLTFTHVVYNNNCSILYADTQVHL